MKNLINFVYGSLSVTLMIFVLCKNYNFANTVSIMLLFTFFVAIGYTIAGFDN